MATTDRTPMGIAHLTVVPAGFDRAGDGPGDDGDEREDEGATDPSAG